MRCLINPEWEKDVEKLINDNSERWKITPISLEYNAGYGEPVRYWFVDFESIEDICEFLGDYSGYRMFYQDGRQMVDGIYCGVKEWPTELQVPFIGLYLDYIGW